jgi:ribose 5-phosphate isomerase B
MKIVIGADHRGFEYKEYLKKQTVIDGMPIEWIDVGAYDDNRSDYPIFAQRLCEKMRSDNIDRGVLICASGGGMAVAANRYKGIYAVVVWDGESVAYSAADNNANVLVIPSELSKDPRSLVSQWLKTKFLGGRYQERIDMIDALGGI